MNKSLILNFTHINKFNKFNNKKLQKIKAPLLSYLLLLFILYFLSSFPSYAEKRMSSKPSPYIYSDFLGDTCQAKHFNSLKGQWAKSLRKAMDKYLRTDELIEHFKRLKKELQSDKTWLGHDPTGNPAIIIGMIAKTTELTANLINNLISLSIPVAGAANNAANRGVIMSANIGEKTYKAFTFGSLTSQKVMGDEIAVLRLAAIVSPVAQAAVTVVDLGKDVYNVWQLTYERQKYIRSFNSALNRLDKAIELYEGEKENQDAFIEQIKDGINRYCSEQEKGALGTKKIEEFDDISNDLDNILDDVLDKADKKSQKNTNTVNFDVAPNALSRLRKDLDNTAEKSFNRQQGTNQQLINVMNDLARQSRREMNHVSGTRECIKIKQQITAYKNGISQLDMRSSHHHDQKQLWQTGIKENQNIYNKKCR